MSTVKSVLSFFALAAVLILAPASASPQDGKAKKNANANGGADANAATTYSGRATVVKAKVLVVETTVCDTGALPESGGCLESSLINLGVDGLLSAKVGHAATVGQGHSSRAEASLAEICISIGGHTITAGLAMSRAAATCDASGAASAWGCSEIASLAVDQVGIAVTGAANQENVSFQGLRIIINEQVKTVDGNCASITVNALRIVSTSLLGTFLAEVVISSSHADICCGGEGDDGHAEVKDFVTGGGFITGTPSGAKGNFGVAGGIKNGSFWGHLNYIDHGTGMHVKHIAITGYEATSATERKITGTCTINGEGSYGFSCWVADNGEPGTNDTFNLFLQTGYAAGGYLQGGNIQLHNK